MTDRPPELRLFTDELIVDNFAGGGGASTGIRQAIGRDPDIAINHDREALALYRANHPTTRVLWQALVMPFLSTYHGEKGAEEARGGPLSGQLPTQDTSNRHALVAPVIARLGQQNGNGAYVNDACDPLTTVTTKAEHMLVAPAAAAAARAAQMRAFLLAYYGTDQDPQLGLPLPTLTTRDRFAVVMVAGVEHVIVDIGMRMLSPRELYLAQGFPAGYVIDLEVDGRALTKGAQVRMVGNSVSPWPAAQLVRAQFQARAAAEVA